MPDQTVPNPDPRLVELARQRRLYALERADGRTDLFASAERVPASTAALRPVATIEGHLAGLVAVATHTAGAFLVVEIDDHAPEVEEIAGAALRAESIDTAAAAMPAVADPRLVTVATRCRSLRVELDRLDSVIDLLDRETRVTFARYTTRIRGELDQLEVDVDKAGAGL